MTDQELEDLAQRIVSGTSTTEEEYKRFIKESQRIIDLTDVVFAS